MDNLVKDKKIVLIDNANLILNFIDIWRKIMSTSSWLNEKTLSQSFRTEKQRKKHFIPGIALLLLVPTSSSVWSTPNDDWASAAVLVGPMTTDVFLQGQFIEAGISQYGSLGSMGAAPGGYHPMNGPNLSIVTDPGRDGWNVGSPPQSGDYGLPGCPEIGWGVEWTIGGTEIKRNNFPQPCTTYTNIPGSVIETSSGGILSAKWEGNATNGSNQELSITKNFYFQHNDSYALWIDVELTNTGSVALDSVEYLQNIDPDQEINLVGGSFTTFNKVIYQPGVGENRAFVTATGLNYGLVVGFYTVDSRAKVSTEGFSNRDPDAILDSPILGPKTRDEAIALAYRFGTLNPGESVTFKYAFVFTEDVSKFDPCLLNLPCTMIGTAGGDILKGTRGDDIICGQGGDDIIKGRGGNDILRGGDGNDVIRGGKGDDLLCGEGGDDRLYGEKGSDVVEGGSDDDRLAGGKGNDFLFGNEGNDMLDGESGSDFCDGGAGVNVEIGCE